MSGCEIDAVEPVVLPCLSPLGLPLPPEGHVLLKHQHGAGRRTREQGAWRAPALPPLSVQPPALPGHTQVAACPLALGSWRPAALRLPRCWSNLQALVMPLCFATRPGLPALHSATGSGRELGWVLQQPH